jgi:hypothetical protein
VFKGRHFDRSVILLCVRWYLAYSLSLRDLEEIMAERGVRLKNRAALKPIERPHPCCALYAFTRPACGNAQGGSRSERRRLRLSSQPSHRRSACQAS